jgi:glutaconate CoA-transferase subunit A
MTVVKLVSPADAADHVEPGCGLALGGVLHANRPAVLVRELVRRGTGELVLYSAPGSGWDADLLIGAGLVRRAMLPMVTMGAIGLAPSFRHAVERGELEAPCFDAMTLVAGYLAAGYGQRFHLIRSVEGTDIVEDPDLFDVLTDSAGARHRAVRALAPDVCVLHVEEADERGNVRHGRGRGADLLMVRAARRTIVFADRIVARAEVRREPHRTTIPGHMVSAVVEARFGAHPTATADYQADDGHLRLYHHAAERRRRGDGAAFEDYLRRFVHTTPEAYTQAIGGAQTEAELRAAANA